MCLIDFFLDDYGKDNDYSVNVCFQSFFIHGDKYSDGSRMKGLPGCHSWRTGEITHILCLDAFYDPLDANAKEFARKWSEENQEEVGTANGVYSQFDRYSIGHKMWPWPTNFLVKCIFG